MIKGIFYDIVVYGFINSYGIQLSDTEFLIIFGTRHSNFIIRKYGHMPYNILTDPL